MINIVPVDTFTLCRAHLHKLEVNSVFSICFVLLTEKEAADPALFHWQMKAQGMFS